ncbi:hypothetical protein TKK_0004304 [Trichogramma kaykai]|uniref:PHD-type domain-containing protein n=1 Tax=Trichogramma kaykai TaxID=54128 RepID=A0ABD2XLT4_9HYME
MSVLNLKKEKRSKLEDIVENLSHGELKNTSTISDNIFGKVESQLENMFAGIVENHNALEAPIYLGNDPKFMEANKPVVATENHTVKTEINEISSPIVAANNVPKETVGLTNGNQTSVAETEKKKKPSKAKKKTAKRKVESDDESKNKSVSVPVPEVKKIRGPVIKMKKGNDKPIFVEVLNTFREDDDDKPKDKKSSRKTHGQNYDFMKDTLNNRSLNSSALNAEINNLWICIFCKQGPHHRIAMSSFSTQLKAPEALGDLFGPYFIKEDNQSISNDNDTSKLFDNQTTLKGIKHEKSDYSGSSEKHKKKFYNNMNGESSNVTMEPKEIWVHEPCTLWTNGVYMVGGRIKGLQSAVHNTSKLICNQCGLDGANIQCIKRKCKSYTHYPCAVAANWELNSDQFLAKCCAHKDQQ